MGVQVFGCPEHYNPAEDTIVSTMARLLRQRLDTYWQSDGGGVAMRVVVSSGGYTAVFASTFGDALFEMFVP